MNYFRNTDIDINLYTIFNINGTNYVINDVIYQGNNHYISIHKRNSIFYLYNDLDKRVSLATNLPKEDTNYVNPFELRLNVSNPVNRVLRTGSIQHLNSQRKYGYEFNGFTPTLIMLKRLE